MSNDLRITSIITVTTMNTMPIICVIYYFVFICFVANVTFISRLVSWKPTRVHPNRCEGELGQSHHCQTRCQWHGHCLVHSTAETHPHLPNHLHVIVTILPNYYYPRN